METNNSIAIVSGGASGMGAATARALSQAGANVVILDRDINKAEQTAKEIHGIAIACDVSNDVDFEFYGLHFLLTKKQRGFRIPIGTCQ